MSKKIIFKTKLWKFSGSGGWHFLTLPKSAAAKIRKTHKGAEEGWGRLKVSAAIGTTKWRSAIWFDTKEGTYLLPVRSDIRKKQSLKIGSTVSCLIEV